MILEVEHNYGDIVYFKTDLENVAYQVTSYLVRKSETIYVLNSAVKGPSQAFSEELSVNPNPQYM